MTTFKKIISIVFFLLLFFPLSNSVFSQNQRTVNVYFFWSKTCPHCAREKVFLSSLASKDKDLEIKSYEISNPDNIKLLQEVRKKIETNDSGFPFTVIGKYHFVGYNDENTTGKAIIDAISCNRNGGCEDLVEPLITNHKESPLSQKPQTVPEKLKVPFIGEIKPKELSLPLLTIFIGFADGFNPCAMWVLLFLISLLFGMKDRKKMWILGITFIGVSGFVYFLFMVAWLNLFLFLSYISWIRIMIGLVALVSGTLNLRKYYLGREGGCEIIDDKKRNTVINKLKEITQQEKFVLSIIGLVILAFSVNLIELVCSAGFPAIYTKILSLAQIPRWQYYFYIFIYIFFYMLDDLAIFIIAMVSLKAVGIQNKYSQISRLLGGILIFIIGLLLLFKPEVLMFG